MSDRAVEISADQPLGLTIHSLPEAGADVIDAAQRTQRGRRIMLMVLLLCAAPVIASYVTYYFIRPQAHRSFGELIEPMQALPAALALDLDGKVHAMQELKGQWLLVSVGSGRCDEACVQRLYLQRQLRESLGKDKNRLDRVWLIRDAEPVAEQLRPGLTEATVLRLPHAELQRWLKPANGHELDEHLYLVDPMGNWMMRFPAGLDISGAGKAKRDLERLMRASASWDREGR